jgi:predicted AlkP superfamily pyrophosphatase or phosphodiesterase
MSLSEKASRTRLPLLLLSVLLAAHAGCSSGAKRAPMSYRADMTFGAQAERVVLVSFDGLRADLVSEELTPQIHSLQSAGAFVPAAESVLPSITLVNHTSMLTGVGPAKHGVDWNSYIPEKGMVTVPTVFELAKQGGLTTAMVAGKEKFMHLNRPGTIDHLVIETGEPEAVAEVASALIRSKHPQLLFVHFRHPDTEGHAHGWVSREQLDAIRAADNALGWILATLEEQKLLESTQVLVTADHGGEGTGHQTGAAVERLIPWVAAGAGVPIRGVIAKHITTYDTAATAASALHLTVPPEWAWEGKAVFF